MGDALATSAIRTHVVALPGAGDFDQVAQAGATEKAVVVSAGDDPTKVSEAFASVLAAARGCD